MTGPLGDREWQTLIGPIRMKKCTPFIGAGASVPALPLGSQLARQWAEQYGYPLEDKSDLARVAQYLAIDQYEMFPKDLLQQQFKDVLPPDFSQADEPHAALADLGLPIYVTTNYDPFMVEALKSRGRDVQREFCYWNRFPDRIGRESVFDGGYKPTPQEPVVYHLHGHTELVQSMVLTETDYLDFLIRFSRDQDFLPPAIREALAGSALLFVGYSLADMNFRVILRGLVNSLDASLGYPTVAVQLPLRGLSQREQERAQAYLDRYFGQIKGGSVYVYWGDARQFARELRDRC